MADIFISYAREDIERVRPIVEELGKLGWTVFWDTTILPGANWPIEITEALKSARCVLVFWSLTSVDFKIHHWIREEAEAGRKKGVLVPLLLDVVDLPIGFSHLQAADLSSWEKKVSDPEFQKLIGAIKTRFSSSPPPVVTPKPKPASDLVSKPVFDPKPNPEPEKTQSYKSLNPKTERPQKVTRNESSFSNIKPKQVGVAVAFVIAIFLLVVGLAGRKQVNISKGQAPTSIAQSTPVHPDSAAARAKQKTNDLLLRQADEAKLKAEKEVVATR
jgi:TIR domain